MTITDLIEWLEQTRRQHGDLDVAIVTMTEGSCECAFDVDPFGFKLVDLDIDEVTYDYVALATSRTRYHFNSNN